MNMNKVGTKEKICKRCGIHHAKWIGTKVGTAGNVYVTRMITREI